MSKVQMLRAFVNQRLTAAADEIFELFERTIAEYEEELYRSTENHRQRKLLDDVFNHEVRSHRADVQQLSMVEEEIPPEQQEWSSSLDQEDPEPRHIKEEQEELCTSQEEADIKFLFISVPVKSEEDEEKPQSSQLHQRQTEQVEIEAGGGPEPARNKDPDSPLQPATHDKTSHSESETDDSRDWEETEEPQSGLNPLQNNVSDVERNTGKTSKYAGSFDNKGHLPKHTGIQTGEKSFSCSVCSKRFSRKFSLITHMRLHTGDKRFSCPDCKAHFGKSCHLADHLRIHTGEKPFSCSVCGQRFTQKQHLKGHLAVHTGEKPYSCSVCNKKFAQHGNLKYHLTVHTGEKPFSCSICDKSFTRLHNFKNHKCVGESSRNK